MIDQQSVIARWGLAGIFALCFLSATLLPGFSEVGLAALVAAGAYRAWTLVWTASVGNWLGGVATYAIGWWLGMDKIIDWLGMSAESVCAVQAWVETYGAWCGLLVWMPVIGDPVAAALGIAHSPIFGTLALMFVGKAVRYIIIVLVMDRVSQWIKSRKNRKTRP